MLKTWAGIAVFLLSCIPAHAQTGHIAPGVGAINHSMAGAGTAMPLDAAGALFWNPASITDLNASEVDITADLILIDSDLSSSLSPNALAPGLPPRTLFGSSPTNKKKAVVGSAAWVHKPNNKRWSYGLLMAEIGGFGFNFRNNGQNPITTPQPPNGVGVGDIFTDYKLLQVAPTFAYEINDHLSVGFAPNLDLSSLQVNPFPFTSPDDANGDGFRTYPKSNRSWATGAGFQVGLYYKHQGWQVGASVKSPQWFESFEFDGSDELGRPRSFRLTLNYPMIVTTGIGYSGLERLRWAADVRYVDYQNTKGFDKTGFNNQTGAVQGLGWSSIWILATGVQVQLSDRIWLRGGYASNQNPVPERNTFFNLGSPLITRSQGNFGFSYLLTERFTVSFAYHHGFTNDIRGSYESPGGAIPGTSVHSKFGADVLILSLNLKP
jgi:long-chain fatty acid transport protein